VLTEECGDDPPNTSMGSDSESCRGKNVLDDAGESIGDEFECEEVVVGWR